MTLGGRIKELRKINKMTQECLAELLDTSRVSVSFWETDINLPSVDKIVQISEIFHVSADYLLKGEKTAGFAECVSQDEQNYFLSTFKSLPLSSRLEVIKFIQFQEYINRIKRSDNTTTYQV